MSKVRIARAKMIVSIQGHEPVRGNSQIRWKLRHILIVL